MCAKLRRGEPVSAAMRRGGSARDLLRALDIKPSNRDGPFDRAQPLEGLGWVQDERYTYRLPRVTPRVEKT